MKLSDCSGFTLVELLLACTLSLLLLSGLATVYTSVKNNNRLQQYLLDLQESGRFAVMLLNQRIRQAGYVACMGGEPVKQDQAIVGYDSDHLPAELQNQVIAGTDAVLINSCVDNKWVSMAYYIGDTHRRNNLGKPILGLFQKPLTADRAELVAGVEQMKISYGLAVNDISGLVYFPAAQVTDWQKVRGVQIELEITSNDQRIHRPWSFYISLRERS